MLISEDSISCKVWKFPAGEVGVQVGFLCYTLSMLKFKERFD